LYAQKLEGDDWLGDRMEIGKIEKMSGMNISFLDNCSLYGLEVMPNNGEIDQQLGQMYELMQAIRKKELAEGNENQPPEAPEKIQ
jgi:hypothetical protein